MWIVNVVNWLRNWFRGDTSEKDVSNSRVPQYKRSQETYIKLPWKELDANNMPTDVCLFAVESIDCGWLIDSGWYNKQDGHFYSTTGTSVKLHMRYTHYIPTKLLITQLYAEIPTQLWELK